LTDGKDIGAVFKANGEPVFTVWADRNGSKTSFRIKSSTPGLSSGYVTVSELYSALNQLNKLHRGQITADMIGRDEQRAAIQLQRAQQKQGSPHWTKSRSGRQEPVHPSSREFNSLARQALQARLTKYKATNAAGVESPEKMLSFIKQKGFLDRIRVGPYSYVLRDAQLDVKNVMTGKEDWNGRGMTVTYRYDDEGNEKTLWGFDFDDFDEEDRPPREFYVKFKAEGGSLVPAEVYSEIEGDRDPETGRHPRKVYREEGVRQNARRLVSQLLDGLEDPWDPLIPDHRERFDRDLELEAGIRVEMEHTDDAEVAKKIALDHLAEDPDYYKKLRDANLADENLK
jgi:hypothetical protein